MRVKTLLLLGTADQQDSQHETLTHGGRLRLQGAAFSLMIQVVAGTFKNHMRPAVHKKTTEKKIMNLKQFPVLSLFVRTVVITVVNCI